MRDETETREQDEAGPELSIVIPIYNEESILETSVTELITELEQAGLDFEIVLAENGSRDRTVAIAEAGRSGLSVCVRIGPARGKTQSPPT